MEGQITVWTLQKTNQRNGKINQHDYIWETKERKWVALGRYPNYKNQLSKC